MLEFFSVNTLLALFLLQNAVEKCTSAHIGTCLSVCFCYGIYSSVVPMANNSG